MRLGLSSFCYRYAASADPRNRQPMSPGTVLKRARAFGLDAVQFSENMPLHLLDAAARADLRTLAADLGLGLEIGTRGLAQEHVSAYLDLAGYFGSRALRLVLDEPDVHAAAAALRGLLPRIEAAGIPLAIENYGELPAAELGGLVETINHPLVGFCVDTTNSLFLLEPPEVTIGAMAPRARQLHLKDYTVVRAPVGYRITGCPLGEGRLDLTQALAQVRPVERDMDVFLEFWLEPSPRWEETLLEEERWIALCVDRARELLGLPDPS